MILKKENEIKILTEIFFRYGFEKQSANLIAKTLTDADQHGIYSHGIQRLFMYDKKLKAGFINPKAKIEIINQTESNIIVDAHQAMGQLTSIEVMNEIINLARKNGVAIATVRNSNHFGAAGYYAKLASEKNLIGFAATSTNPLLVPPGATNPFLGSNPFAISFPTEESDFTFDGATSTVSLGKIEVLDKKGQLIPGEWAVDERGQLENSPSKVIDHLTQTHRTGGILPIGGMYQANSNYKGFAISLIIEIITAIFSQGSLAVDLGSKNHDISHFFMVLNPRMFGDLQSFKIRLTEMLKRLKAAGESITLPGEKEKLAFEKNKKNGIKIDDTTFKQIKQICKELKINFNGGKWFEQ